MDCVPIQKCTRCINPYPDTPTQPLGRILTRTRPNKQDSFIDGKVVEVSDVAKSKEIGLWALGCPRWPPGSLHVPHRTERNGGAQSGWDQAPPFRSSNFLNLQQQALCILRWCGQPILGKACAVLLSGDGWWDLLHGDGWPVTGARRLTTGSHTIWPRNETELLLPVEGKLHPGPREPHGWPVQAG